MNRTNEYRSPYGGKFGHRAGVAVAALALAICIGGCSHLPYRIEWGSQRDADAEPTTAAPFRPNSKNSRLAAWEALHRDLIEKISARRFGDPVPTGTVEECVKALRLLRADVAATGHAAFDDTSAVYERLLGRRQLAPPRSHIRQLDKLRRAVTGAVAAHPTPVDTTPVDAPRTPPSGLTPGDTE
ncbi:MAG: hypothetical protein AAF581_12750 [Planctomycetota bacterium]